MAAGKAQKKKMKLWKKILIGVLVVVLVAGIGGYAFIRNMMRGQSPIAAANPSDQTLVNTTGGDIRGSYEDGVYQYLGVPYATATKRFVPAEDVTPWEGVLDATQVGPMSPQSGMLGMSAGGNQEGTDNNSQNLNIWTPGTDGKKRAVMVWLHGGGFSTGTANSQDYNGLSLSSYGDVVVVGVNHRLGAAGFLDLSAYGDEYKYSGNVGMTDIVKALEWIHNNIEAFGGDPENVTVFGQSGGGAKVLALMTSPYAKGLFQRGIVQSGATETMGVTFSSKEASLALTERVLTNLNITSDELDKLQTIEWSELESATSQALQDTANEFQILAPLTDGYAMEWGPVVDGDYMPSNPVTEDSFAENGKDITLLIGSNLTEWNGFMGNGQSEVSDEVKAAYAEAYPSKDSANAGKVDTLIRLPMLKIMSHKADQNGANVYAYVFTEDSGAGAYHGAEIPYVFHHQEGTLGDQMTQLWVNFAKTGVPSADGIPTWEPYTREGGATMLLDQTSSLVYGHDRELMKLLAPEYVY